MNISERFRTEGNIAGGCPNGPDEHGEWPCDPKGYFGVLECQVCGRVGVLADQGWPGRAALGGAAEETGA